MSQDLTPILEGFGGEKPLAARMVTGRDGQRFIQLRIDLGALQMHLDGRPDGERPEGRATFLDYLHEQTPSGQAGGTPPSDEQWEALDREVMQFYHRRIAFLTMGDAELQAGRLNQAADCFRRALRDGKHNLRGLDFIRRHHPDAQFVAGHEQYRTFLLTNCGLAASKLAIARQDVEEAIEQLKHWQQAIRETYVGQAADDEAKGAEGDDGLKELARFEKMLRREYDMPRTLQERLEDAIEAERFEEAARLRDQVRARQAAMEARATGDDADPADGSQPTTEQP
jgi:tetratricopeptide (TPR) repeat protein